MISSIVLRKHRGIKGATALFKRTDDSAWSGTRRRSGIAGIGFALGILAFVLVVVAFLATLFAPAAIAHPAPLMDIPVDTIGPVGLAVAGNLATQVKELNEKITAKNQVLEQTFEKSGETFDFARKDVLDHLGVKDSAAAVAKINEINTEITDIAKKRDELQQLERVSDETKRRRETPANQPPLPGGAAGEPIAAKLRSLGEIVVGAKAFKRYQETGAPSKSEETGWGLRELKAAFTTAAGWAPESLRIPGLVIEKATRPIQVLDIIPSGPTKMSSVKYMEETTRTHAAAERAENAAYAESTFELTERSQTVESIGERVPVTDEQLEDVDGAQTYLEQRLMFGVRQRLDGQSLVGDGNTPNLLGFLNKPGIQTQAKGADPTPDAIFKAMTLVRVTGRAFPNAAIFHPTNWQTVRLLKTADGIYLWGSPSEAGPERIWGLQVVQADSITLNTALVGDYANFSALYEKRGVVVEVGYVNADFGEGRKTIRAGLRVALVIYRAAAFCTVTGLN